MHSQVGIPLQINACHSQQGSLLYIANCLRQKSFAVVELNWNSLENVHSYMAAWCGLVWPYVPIISLNFHSCKLVHKNCETFPPQRPTDTVDTYHACNQHNIQKNKTHHNKLLNQNYQILLQLTYILYDIYVHMLSCMYA